VAQPPPTPLENGFIRVVRNAAPCALASPSVCGARVLVALGPIDIVQDFRSRHMQRGDIAVFRWYDSYGPPTGGEFVEVSIKEEHPRVDAPAIRMPLPDGAMRIDTETFFVYDERLEPDHVRPRHSHSQRVVIVLDAARVIEGSDGGDVTRTETPGDVRFETPRTHSLTVLGNTPLNNLVIELKP
jgi:hypothetical protein